MNAMLKPLLLAAVLPLAACQTLGPDYRLPATSDYSKAMQAAPKLADADGASVATDGALPVRWWSLYGDPVLDGLVAEALRANAGLRIARAHLAEAQAAYDEARDAGGPDAAVQGSAARAQLSPESLLQESLPVANYASGTLSASYQLDLFGKLKRGVEAAGAHAEAQQAAVDLARISVAARVTGAYLDACNAADELAVAHTSVRLQQRSTEVTQRLAEAGRGTATDVARARTQLATLEAALPPLDARGRAARHALSALLGRLPGDLPESVALCHRAPALRQPIPVGDGAALLRRRPDVRQAERELAAATARIGVATAALYPDVRLGAEIGATGLLEDFGQSPTRLWSLGPLIHWSWPTEGAHARVRASQAGADAALAQFDRVVLNALRETRTALDRYAADLRRVDALAEAEAQARVAADQNGRLYLGGRLPYLTSLDAERTLAERSAALAAAHAEVSRDQVQVFLALGGGWQGSAAPLAAH